MPGDQSRRTVISFGPFEADLHTQELRKLGVRLRLPRQSFQILKMLLERAGGLVTREELQQALWPSDTFVDFEGGVNAAVNRLREALGDSADSPHFVETLPRRGYRFIGAIGPALVQADAVPLPPSAEARNASASGLTWLKIGTWILAGMACGIAGGFAYLRSRPHPESVALTPVPFTAYRMGPRSPLPGMEIPR